MAKLHADDRVALWRFLEGRFTLSDLEDLAFCLDIDYEELRGDTPKEKARELIVYCERRDLVNCLLREVLKVRDSPEVAQIAARARACDPQVKVEVFVRGATIANINEVIAEIARKAGLQPSEVALISAVEGSLRLLLSLPADAADFILTNGPGELAGGKYMVESVRGFDTLSRAEQEAWKSRWRTGQGVSPAGGGAMTVRAGAATGAAGGGALVSGGFTIGKILLVLLVVAAVGAGAGVLAAPTLTFQNNCSEDIPLPVDVPIIGNKISKGTSPPYQVWPGDYRITRTGDSLRLTGPLGIDSGDFTYNGNFRVLKDGREQNVTPPATLTLSSGLPGSKATVIFSCR